MRFLLEQCKKELRILARDRQALILIFLMPTAFAVCLSLALKDIYSEKQGKQLRLEWHDQDKTEFTDAMREILSSTSGISLVEKSDDTAHGTITLQAGFSQAAFRYLIKGEGKPEAQRKIILALDPRLDMNFSRFLKQGIFAAMQGAMLASLAGRLIPVKTDEIMAAVFVEKLERVHVPNPLQHAIPGWALFGMFFIALPIASSFFREKDTKTAARLLISPAPNAALVAGKLASFVAINQVQFWLLVVIGIAFMPLISELKLSTDFSFLSAAAFALAAGFAATSFGILVSIVTKSLEQAASLAILFTVTFSAIGGVMVPVIVMPELMQRLAAVSPLYWGLEGFYDILVEGKQFSQVAFHAGILVVFGLICLTVSTFKFTKASKGL